MDSGWGSQWKKMPLSPSPAAMEWLTGIPEEPTIYQRCRRQSWGGTNPHMMWPVHLYIPGACGSNPAQALTRLCISTSLVGGWSALLTTSYFMISNSEPSYSHPTPSSLHLHLTVYSISSPMIQPKFHLWSQRPCLLYIRSAVLPLGQCQQWKSLSLGSASPATLTSRPHSGHHPTASLPAVHWALRTQVTGPPSVPSSSATLSHFFAFNMKFPVLRSTFTSTYLLVSPTWFQAVGLLSQQEQFLGLWALVPFPMLSTRSYEACIYLHKSGKEKTETQQVLH